MMSYQVIADLFIIIDPKFYITTPQKWTAFHFLSSNIFIIISFLHQFPPQNPIHIRLLMQNQSQSPNQSPYVPSYTTDGLLKFTVNGLPHDAKHYNDQCGLDLVYKIQHLMSRFKDPHQLNDEPIHHSEENEKSRVILLSSIRKELINVGVFTLGTVISKKLAARNFVIGSNQQPPTRSHHIELVVKGERMNILDDDRYNLFEMIFVDIIRTFTDVDWKDEAVGHFMQKYGLAFEQGVPLGFSGTKKCHCFFSIVGECSVKLVRDIVRSAMDSAFQCGIRSQKSKEADNSEVTYIQHELSPGLRRNNRSHNFIYFRYLVAQSYTMNTNMNTFRTSWS